MHEVFGRCPIAHKEVRNLRTARLDSVHVGSVPDGDETSGKNIAFHVDQHGLIVITKDLEFYHSHRINLTEKNYVVSASAFHHTSWETVSD